MNIRHRRYRSSPRIRYRCRSRNSMSHPLCSRDISHIHRRSNHTRSIFRRSPCRPFRRSHNIRGICLRTRSIRSRIHSRRTDRHLLHNLHILHSGARCSSLRRLRHRSDPRCRISSRHNDIRRRIRILHRPHNPHIPERQTVTIPCQAYPHRLITDQNLSGHHCDLSVSLRYGYDRVHGIPYPAKFRMPESNRE